MNHAKDPAHNNGFPCDLKELMGIPHSTLTDWEELSKGSNGKNEDGSGPAFKSEDSQGCLLQSSLVDLESVTFAQANRSHGRMKWGGGRTI